MQQAASELEPADRDQVMGAADGAIASGTGLVGWFWAVHGLLVQRWGSTVCCRSAELTKAGALLQAEVMARVRLARMLVAAYKLLYPREAAQ
jgi:hypothetical protein